MSIISDFLTAAHSKDEYIAFCARLVCDKRPDAGTLLQNLIEQGLMEAPASTKYHGASKGGLIKHNLIVVEELDTLIDAWHLAEGQNENWKQEAILAAFFHDACKVRLYKEQKLWRKDEYGKWESYLGYVVDNGLIQIGHGEESLRIVERYFRFEYEQWALAIRWHMGFPDGYVEKQQYMRACEKYPEILALHTADMRACLSGRY